MGKCIPLLVLLTCKQVGAQQPAAVPPILVLDSGGHTSLVKKVIFTPDGKELISVSEDKTIRFWDVDSGETIRVVRPPIEHGSVDVLYTAALSPDGRTLAVGGYGLKDAIGSIYLISTVTGANRSGADGAHECDSRTCLRRHAGRPSHRGLRIGRQQSADLGRGQQESACTCSGVTRTRSAALPLLLTPAV